MIRTALIAVMFAFFVSLAGCTNVQSPTYSVKEYGTAASVKEVRFSQLSDTVWMHTSYEDVPDFGLVPANGLIVIDGANSVLVDTAWNDEQTRQIVEWANTKLQRPIEAAVFTHAHSDKMGGVGALRASGIDTYALNLSNRIAPSKNLTPAEHDLVLKEGEATTIGPLEIFYPGAGHTADNIVVNIPTANILFGGCLIRPGDTNSLGNTADADIAHWGTAATKTGARFPYSTIVVPSHGIPGDRELLVKTRKLAEAGLP